MAIPFLSDIEKLINEHGSAVILKERLALATDQYSALNNKISACNIRIAHLETECENLQSKNRTLQAKINDAQEIIRKLNERDERVLSHGENLKEIEVNILIHASRVKSNSIKDISASLSCGEAVIEYHLEELKSKGMVSFEYMSMVGDLWSLEQPGRKYLVANGLIS